MMDPLKITIEPLYLGLKTTFKQASSLRRKGESIWVRAERGNLSGLGEGCPRTSTGVDVISSIKWSTSRVTTIQNECHNLDALKTFVASHRQMIDQYPAAWCAIETALLDLFAREAGVSVEQLLALQGPQAIYQYSAVLPDSEAANFRSIVGRYLKWGFTDFKVKVNGHLERDQMKLKIIDNMCREAGVKDVRIRLDANNLWANNEKIAIDFLSQLSYPILGIEEPVTPKSFESLSNISTTLDMAIILDESLCTLKDFETCYKLPGEFIANIKVSRVGGIFRSLELVALLKARNQNIIVGAHVGETSVLTRAGMCIAKACEGHLIAHEGGFGKILLSKDTVKPSLMFGAGGQLDLSNDYMEKDDKEHRIYSTSRWNLGWGLESIL